MKVGRIINALEYIDETLILEAIEEKKREKLVDWKTIGAIAACLTILVTSVIWPYLSQSIKHGEGNTSEIEISTVIPWEEIETISGRYPYMSFQGNEYCSTGKSIDSKLLRRYLEEAELRGLDENETLHYTKGKIYEIDGVLVECAVAVKFEEEDSYFIYDNSYYSPATLQEFIEDLNLRENMFVGTANGDYALVGGDYTWMEYEGLETSDLFQILFTNPEMVVLVSDTKEIDEMLANKIMSIGVDIPIVGCENRSITLCEGGYLKTNILNSGKVFYIGEEKIKTFVEYVLENCKGHTVTLKDDDGVPE